MSEQSTFTWHHVLYRFYDTGGSLLYIGITNDIRNRFPGHATKQPWWPEVADCRTEFLPSREALEEAEVVAIQAERPRYNKRHNNVVKKPSRGPFAGLTGWGGVPEKYFVEPQPTPRELPPPYVRIGSSPPRADAILADDCWGAYWKLPDGRTINPKTGEPFFGIE